MPSPNTKDQTELVHQADHRMAECFEQLTGDALVDPKSMRFVSLMIIWAEEYATLRRMQGDDGIRWGRDTVNYNAAKVETLDRIAAKAKAKTTDNTEEES